MTGLPVCELWPNRLFAMLPKFIEGSGFEA